MQKIKVKLLTSIAGHSDERYDQPDFGYAPGQVVELHPDLATAWVSSGLAELETNPGSDLPDPNPQWLDEAPKGKEAAMLPAAKPRKAR